MSLATDDVLLKEHDTRLLPFKTKKQTIFHSEIEMKTY